MGVWKQISRPSLGFLDDLSNAIVMLETVLPGALVATNDAPMWIASDYSGQHKDAAFETYSFLITTSDSLRQWNRERIGFRSKHLPDGRRLSFKQRSEPIRARALAPFLALANDLCGNLFTFAVDKRLSLFSRDSNVEAADLPEVFPAGTSSSVAEKTVRVATFLSLLVAGMRDEDQPATWISDQDEALEYHERRERLGQFISCLTFGMTGWRNPATMEFGTTSQDWPDRRLEDFVAIPDLAAGALAVLAPSLAVPEYAGMSTNILRRENATDPRTRDIIDWIAERDHPLRRVLLRLCIDDSGTFRAWAESIQFIRTIHTARE